MRKYVPIFFLYVGVSLPLVSIANDKTVTVDISNDTLQQVQYVTSQLNRNLSLVQFFSQIQAKYPSSYRFLTKLSAQQQKEVYRFYQTENNFEPIRHKIFTLFFAIPATE